MRPGDVVAAGGLFRIASDGDWAAARQSGVYPYSEMDRADGFLHLSTRAQALQTADAYFPGRTDLLALEIDAAQLAAPVRFERSRAGDLFPHLYGDLPATAVTAAFRLVLRNGAFSFGDAL